MPPAFSDDEGSDVEMDHQSATSAVKSGGRVRPDVKYTEIPPEDDASGSGDKRNGDAGEDDQDGEEDDEDLEEEVYVVEKIMSHMIDKGTPLFEVKWEGYDKKSDRTWEPEENLVENASDALNDYLLSIGGRDKLFEDTAAALKTKKRGRPTSATPQAAGKRSRRDHPADSEPPASAKAVTWKPPPGSWEDHIVSLDACEDEDSGKLTVYLTWKNGQKTQHSTSVIYQRCPQKMLQFYERHVKVVRRDPGTVTPE